MYVVIINIKCIHSNKGNDCYIKNRRYGLGYIAKATIKVIERQLF